MHKLFSSSHIIRKNELDSTNNYAFNLINKTNPVHGTVVLTQSQTKGRGQRNNSWESEYGKNLTISLILRPIFLPVHLQFGISKVISLGVLDYLSKHLQRVSIKWPNDIYVGDEKIAGILIEHSVMGGSLSYSVCGIGLNVNQRYFVSDASNPTSMVNQTQIEYGLEECLSDLLHYIEERYGQLESSPPDLDRDYLDVLYRKDGYHLFASSLVEFEARIKGVTSIGQIILENSTGEESIYNFKEIRFII